LTKKLKKNLLPIYLMNKAESFTSKPRSHDIDFDHDSEGYLIYNNTIEKSYPLLEPGKQIKDSHVVIAKVGQQNILPNHLTLKPRDLVPTQVTDESGNPINKPVPPGLSGFLFFSEHEKKDRVREFSLTQLAKDLHTKSRLHIAQVGDIVEAGWKVYYAPLINRDYRVYNPLHVIISPNSYNNWEHESDASQMEKETLAKAFVRW
jgi:hypothetical protein